MSLEQTLIELINQTVESGKGLKDFALEQIPEVLQQTLLWYGAYNFVMFVLAVVLTCVTVLCNVKFFRWLDGPRGDDTTIAVVLVMDALALSAIALMVNLEWLKIWLAPKLWLIEFAASVMKEV